MGDLPLADRPPAAEALLDPYFADTHAVARQVAEQHARALFFESLAGTQPYSKCILCVDTVVTATASDGSHLQLDGYDVVVQYGVHDSLETGSWLYAPTAQMVHEASHLQAGAVIEKAPPAYGLCASGGNTCMAINAY